jgi:transcriptional regulator with XRE-family HTH domain
MGAQARESGKRIAERRRALHLTQETLAERAGVNVKTVQGVEQGRTEPELRTMRRIARALDSTVDELIDGQRGSPATAPSDPAIREIEANLRRCSPRVVKHIAALVRALARARSRR